MPMYNGLCFLFKSGDLRMWRCLTFSSVLLVAGALAASPENYPTKPTKLAEPQISGGA